MNFTKIHWWLPKVLCLILACAFWLYVMNEQNPIMSNTYTVPVEVRNLDRSLVALNVPQSVRVDVRMSRNGLMQLRSDNIKAYVDLANMTDGDYPNTRIVASVPGDGEAVAITPPYFDLKIDTYAVKSLPITVSFFGDLPSGYKSKLDNVTPGILTVAGSSSAVAAVDRAVVSVNLAGKTADFSEFDSIGVLDANGSTVTGIDIMPTQVKVSIKVDEEMKTANVPLTAQVKGQPADGFRVESLSISPSQVTVTAPGSVLEHMKGISLGEIDVAGAEQNIKQVMTVPLPEKASSIPATAEVTVTVDGTKKQ